MNKAEFVSYVAAERMVGAVFSAIADALAREEPAAMSLTALMEPPMSGLMEPLTGADLGSRTG